MSLSQKQRTLVTILLLVLAVWDLVLWAVAFFAPETWFDNVHGADYVDPQGLLRRTGATWLAFAIFQFVAFLRWKRAPFWLVFVAGMRLSELVADWVYAGSAQDLTTVGLVSLLATPVFNVVISVLLMRAYFAVAGRSGGT